MQPMTHQMLQRHQRSLFQYLLHKLSPARWFLLLWVGLLYLWGAVWGSIVKEQIASTTLSLFTLLMLIHAGLYVGESFISFPTRWLRCCYIAFQALLIVLISLVSRRFTITVGLYLALAGELTCLLLTVRMTLLVGMTCLGLLSVNLVLLYGWQHVPLLAQHLVPLHIALLAVLPLFLLIVGYALQQTRAHRRTQMLLHRLECAHQHLAEDAIRLEALTRTAERERMARELHDTLAQGLAGLILQLEAAKAHLVNHREQRALEIVSQALGRARTGLAAARCAIDDLRAEMWSPAALQEALEEEIERFTAATGIPCLRKLAALSLVPEPYGEPVVRMVAEGLLNVARHAQASQVWVSIAKNEQVLDIEVRDNGIGFDPTTVTQQGHYGLLGLRERARVLGGQFALSSAPGQGTRLHLLLPLPSSGETL